MQRRTGVGLTRAGSPLIYYIPHARILVFLKDLPVAAVTGIEVYISGNGLQLQLESVLCADFGVYAGGGVEGDVLILSALLYFHFTQIASTGGKTYMQRHGIAVLRQFKGSEKCIGSGLACQEEKRGDHYKYEKRAAEEKQ